jgi:hypothetical protein
MKKKRFEIIFTAILLFFCFSFLNAQSHREKNKKIPECGLNQTFLKSLADPSRHFAAKQSAQNTSAAGTLICGRFKFYLQDVALSVGYGFDDPGTGTAYQQCLCDAATYIQSILNIPAGDGSLIEININQSWDYAHNPVPSYLSSYVLATGGPYFSSQNFVNNVAGFYGGNAYDHCTTGNDPDTTTIDGDITFNFGMSFTDCSLRYCGSYDLYTVSLHELTHVLGWLSGIKENATTKLPESFFGSNKFSKYDQYFLYYGNIYTGPFTQLVNHSSLTNPYINSSIPANALTSGNIWLNNVVKNTYGANQNCTVLALDSAYIGSSAPNSISHFDDIAETYGRIGFVAPGFTPDYVMGEFINDDQQKRTYTNQELRALQKMGYVFSSSFLNSHSINANFTNQQIINNTHPYTTKVFIDSAWFNSFAATDNIDLGNFTPVDYSITACQSVTINLSADVQIKDAENDPIFIYPGSLFNIRGCGLPGNNHNALTVNTSTAGDVITYNPPPGFVGRAQFGFHLYDGKEKGPFIIYTIDVSACNSCIGTNPNLIVNGTFESGEEVKTLSNPSPDNSNIMANRYKKYPPASWALFSDGKIYPGGGSQVVRESKGCTQNEESLDFRFLLLVPGG